MLIFINKVTNFNIKYFLQEYNITNVPIPVIRRENNNDKPSNFRFISSPTLEANEQAL